MPVMCIDRFGHCHHDIVLLMALQAADTLAYLPLLVTILQFPRASILKHGYAWQAIT